MIGKGRIPQGTNPRTGTAWKAGDVPGTWGEAVSFRSAGQGFSKVGLGSNSGFDPRALPGGGVRDPSFPATGSRDMPMRVQPGPLEEQRIDPTAGGSMIKSGGVRKNVPTGKGVKGVIEDKTADSGPNRRQTRANRRRRASRGDEADGDRRPRSARERDRSVAAFAEHQRHPRRDRRRLVHDPRQPTQLCARRGTEEGLRRAGGARADD